MNIMKQVVQEHSTKWRHDPPSYVTFCTVVLSPKFCSLYLPPNPPEQWLSEWIPAPNFVNKYPEVKKLNDMIIQKNKEGGQDLKLVRFDYHGVKRFKSGSVQHKYDNKPGATPVWREQQVFRKLHFTMENKIKMVSFISSCFLGNSCDTSTPASQECLSSPV